MKGTDRKVIFQGVHQLMGSDLGPSGPKVRRVSKMVFIGIDLPQDIFQGLEQCLGLGRRFPWGNTGCVVSATFSFAAAQVDTIAPR